MHLGGKIDLGKVGLYALRIEKEYIRAVLHRPTGTWANVNKDDGFKIKVIGAIPCGARLSNIFVASVPCSLLAVGSGVLFSSVNLK